MHTFYALYYKDIVRSKGYQCKPSTSCLEHSRQLVLETVFHSDHAKMNQS